MNSELKISIYSHDDDFIDLLYTSEREFDGQCFNPILTVNANGAKTFAFSMPLKILDKANNEYVDNERWQYVTNQYKIRVEREGEETEEFVLRDYTESHNESDQMMIDINCMSLAEFELGQTGYNLTFNEQTLYVYPDNVDPNDPDVKPIGVETSDIHFWANKIVENTDWDYRVESYYPVDEELKENDNRQIVADDNIYTGPNQFYENDRIIDYTNENQPIKKEAYDIKERIVKAEKSNRWNLSQDLCESFEIWADYEIKYKNGKVVSKTIVFKNDIPEDALFSVRYGKNQKSISRQVDDSQIVTKMYVTPLTNPNTDSGVVAIANNAKNYTKENYILDFSWYLGEEREDTDLKNKQLLPKDLSYTFETDLLTIPLFETTAVNNTKDLIDTYKFNLRCRNTFIEQATQNLNKAKEELSELKAQYEYLSAQKDAALEQVNTIIDEIALLPKGVQTKENKTVYIYQEGENYIIRFSEVGVKSLPYTGSFSSPNNIVTTGGIFFDENTISNLQLAVYKREPITQTITEVRLVNGRIGDAQDYASFKMDLDYYPLEFQNKLKQYWLNKVNEATQELLKLGRGRDNGATSGLIYEKEVEVDSLKLSLLQAQRNKIKLTNQIELLLAPFVREGYWEDSSYTTYMNQADNLYNQTPTEEIIPAITNNEQWSQDYWCYQIPNILIGNVLNGEKELTQQVYLYDIIDIDSIEVMNKSIVTAEYDDDFKMYLKGNTETSQGVDYTIEYGYTNTDKQSLTNRGIYIKFYDPENNTTFIHNTGTELYVRAKARGSNQYIYEGYIGNQSFDDNGTQKRMWFSPLEQVLTIEHEDVILSSIEVILHSANLKALDGNTSQLQKSSYNLIYGKDYYTFKETIVNKDDEGKIIDAKVMSKIRLNYTNNVPLLTFADNSCGTYEIHCNYDVTSKYYYNDALDTMKESSIPQVTYSVSIANLNQLQHPGLNFNSFKPVAGTRVPIYDEELNFNGITGFINTVSFNLLEPQNTEITISNFKDKFEDLFQKITAATIQLQNKGDYYDYATTITENTGVINKDLLADTLMQNNVELSLSTNNDVVWSEKGIEVTSKVLNENGVYGKMKITSNGIFIADSYDEYGNYKWETAITPSYINASKMVVGKLDTRQIQIWNSSQPRFLWNENGIYAYGQDKDGNTDFNSYVLYNQDGLQFRQLVEKTNQITFTNLLQHPDFSTGYEDYWSSNAKLDIQPNVGYNSLIGTTEVATNNIKIQHAQFNLNKDHKYYYRATVNIANTDNKQIFGVAVGLQSFQKSLSTYANEIKTISGVVSNTSIENLFTIQVTAPMVAQQWSAVVTQPMLIDLTATFGSDVIVTAEEMDKIPFFATTYTTAAGDTFKTYNDIIALDWNGLRLTSQEGALQLTSDNGLEVFEPDTAGNKHLRVQVGEWEETNNGKIIKKYGIRGIDNNGHTCFEISQEGFQMFYGGSTDTVENIIENNLAYNIYINSSNGLMFKDGHANTTLTATIKKGQETITKLPEDLECRWIRTSADTEGDAIWNANTDHHNILELYISPKDVSSQATFHFVLQEKTNN